MPKSGLPADCRDAGKADWRRIRVKALWKSKNIWGTVFHHVPDISDIPEVPLCDGIWKNVFAAAGGRALFSDGEMLLDGNLSQKNIQCSNKKKTTPLQKIEYICREGVNEYKTTFAIFGFQYAEVQTDIAISAEDFTAIAAECLLSQTLL